MGKLFVIDGTDGSGKQTQFELLKKHLIQTAHDFVSQDDIWLKKNLGKSVIIIVEYRWVKMRWGDLDENL